MPGGPAQDPGPVERYMLDILKARIENQTATAAKIGVSQPQLSRYLDGQKPMRLTEFIRLCEVVGLDPAALMADAEHAAKGDAGEVG